MSLLKNCGDGSARGNLLETRKTGTSGEAHLAGIGGVDGDFAGCC